MEGLQIDQLRIYEAGEPKKDLSSSLRTISGIPNPPWVTCGPRSPRASSACARLEELFTKFGRDVVLDSVQRIFADTEAKCRKIVEQIPDGVYEAESFIDNSGYREIVLPLRSRCGSLSPEAI